MNVYLPWHDFSASCLCSDVQDILDRGVYCFRNRDLKEKVTSRMLVCRVGPGAAAHAEGSSEQETSGLSSNEFDLEELLDLRNKLVGAVLFAFPSILWPHENDTLFLFARTLWCCRC